MTNFINWLIEIRLFMWQYYIIRTQQILFSNRSQVFKNKTKTKDKLINVEMHNAFVYSTK